MVDHGLPDEDGAAPGPSTGSGRRVRIVRGPAASNLDEWWQLREASDCRWATKPADLSDAELVVLPGSKLPMTDLAWMRKTGVDAAISSAHRRGVRILAVCGGAQILGEVVEDPHGVEGGGASRGLGLLPATTTLEPTKRVRRSSCQFRPDLPAPWGELSGLCVEGYEVHYGETRGWPPLAPVFTDGSGLVGGSILAVYLHGLAEDPKVLMALAGRESPRPLTQVIDGLADLVDRHLDMDAVLRMTGCRPVTSLSFRVPTPRCGEADTGRTTHDVTSGDGWRLRYRPLGSLCS
jgi:adenosylcobyric acid synthase